MRNFFLFIFNFVCASMEATTAHGSVVAEVYELHRASYAERLPVAMLFLTSREKWLLERSTRLGVLNPSEPYKKVAGAALLGFTQYIRPTSFSSSTVGGGLGLGDIYGRVFGPVEQTTYAGGWDKSATSGFIQMRSAPAISRPASSRRSWVRPAAPCFCALLGELGPVRPQPRPPSFTRRSRSTPPPASPSGRFFCGRRISLRGSLSGTYRNVCFMQTSAFLSLSQRPDTCSEVVCAPRVMRGHPYPQHSLPCCTTFLIVPSFFFFYFSTVCPRLHHLPAAFQQVGSIHPAATSSGADPTISSPLGFRRHRASSYTAGDDFSTDSSVAWCGFHLRLSRPFFNRRMARLIHPAVLASGDTSAFHRRVRLRLCHLLCCNPVCGPLCITAFFEGLYCNMAA